MTQLDELEQCIKIIKSTIGRKKKFDKGMLFAYDTCLLELRCIRIQAEEEPKTYNINIETLVETINNNVSDITGGRKESNARIRLALKRALRDTQPLIGTTLKEIYVHQ